MKEHKCELDDVCSCSLLADEPDENCPVHGHGVYPPRCKHCGQFMKNPFPYEDKEEQHG